MLLSHNEKHKIMSQFLRKAISQEEARAKTTAWALTFADLTTLLLTFFVMLLVILNDAESHVDRWINIILDETNTELQPLNKSNLVDIDRVTKGIKITLRGRLFKSLSAEVDPKVDPILTQIGGIIRTSTLFNLKNQNRYMSFSETLDLEFGGKDTNDIFHQLGLELIENTPEEIHAVTVEMDERLNGTWQTTKEDEELQQRFWALFGPDKLKSPDLRIGADFLRQYKELIR